MAKENSYNVLAKPTAKRGRNAFNLNNQHVYSMKAGLITPVKAVHFMPGDYFKLKASDFTITFPMNSAPFLRARKEFSFYSVYYNAVWSLFNQYMAGRQDPKSSAFGQTPVLQEPRIKLLNMYASVLNQFCHYVFLEYMLPVFVSYYNTQNTLGLTDEQLEIITKNAKMTFLGEEGPNTNSSCWHPAILVDFGSEVTATFSWNIVGTDAFYPVTWSAFNVCPFEFLNGSTPNFDKYLQDTVGHYRFSNQLRKLDMYGYGNYYSTFNTAERNIKSLVAKWNDGSITYVEFTTFVNNEALAIMWTLIRSLCTWVVETDTPTEAQIVSYKMVNLYPLCSHNSIFYHFFRNSFYDNDYFSHDYSLDFVSAGTGGSGYNEVTMNDFSSRFLDCEYHQWKKDMFTSVLPDDQFGAVSSIQFSFIPQSTGNDLGRWLTSDGSDLNNYNPVKTLGNNVPDYQNSLIDVNSDNSLHKVLKHTHTFKPADVAFDMIALKRAEMLQEYRQTLMRAGNKTSDVFRALYGGAPSSEHLDDIIPRFLETFGEDLVVDPVISTANTEAGNNGKLGDISARGKCSGQSKEFKFDAGENFGCIICLAYVVPTSMYNSYMLDKHLTELTPEQHFIPNFENCGLEDVYSDELNLILPANKIHSLGKQARYYHKKTDVDKVHGAFVSRPTYSILSSVDVVPMDDKMYYGLFNHWVSVRSDMQARSLTALRDFYINPAILDNIFAEAVDADQSSDQFLSTTLIEVDATKQISKVGMVNFV